MDPRLGSYVNSSLERRENVVSTFLIEPMRLYDAQFVADIAGVSRRVVYDAVKYKRSIRMPVVTRLSHTDAGGIIRFRGQHILDWLDQSAGIESVASVVATSDARPVKRSRGRPRNGMRGAK